MQVRYSCLGSRSYGFSRGLMIIAGLLVLPLTAKLQTILVVKNAPVKPAENPAKPANPAKTDPRAIRLRSFFAKLHCPVQNLSEDFVQAADVNQLDWRLLPSISIIESGGGKAYRNNNLFGWNNGDDAFPTLRAGLDLVAYKLGKSPLYRNRDVMGKLRIYNPDVTYPGKVITVMNRISPTPTMPEVLLSQPNPYAYGAD